MATAYKQAETTDNRQQTTDNRRFYPVPVCERAKRSGSVICCLSASEAMRVWSEAEPSV
jgi:hypothetical protein